MVDSGGETLVATCCSGVVRLWSLRRMAEPLQELSLLPLLLLQGGGPPAAAGMPHHHPASAGGAIAAAAAAAAAPGAVQASPPLAWSPAWVPCMSLSPRGGSVAVTLGGGPPALFLVDLLSVQGGAAAVSHSSSSGSGWDAGGGPATAASDQKVSVLWPRRRRVGGLEDGAWSDPWVGGAGGTGPSALSCSWHPSQDVVVVGYSDGAVQTLAVEARQPEAAC